MDFGVVVHGGAGSLTLSPDADISKRRQVLRLSVESGFEVLKRRGSATEAVQEAIQVLEDSAVFNAGAGSCLNLEGKIGADAAIMNGNLTCGAIGAANAVKNPISLARLVMERSDHVLIVGDENVKKFAKVVGARQFELKPAPFRLKQYQENIAKMKKGRVDTWPKNFKLLRKYQSFQVDKTDTVGSVAIDKFGNVCAGVSTGGRWLKLPGRVGDSAVVGAGLYAANSSGAAVATGAGEDIIRTCLCKSVCDFMKMGADAQTACNAAINSLSRTIGEGVAGVIAVDKLGRFGSARNTEMMQRAFKFSNMPKAHVAVLPTESDPILDPRKNRKQLWF
jgi:beta-aspartyl-peptidase (threonine type)